MGRCDISEESGGRDQGGPEPRLLFICRPSVGGRPLSPTYVRAAGQCELVNEVVWELPYLQEGDYFVRIKSMRALSPAIAPFAPASSISFRTEKSK